MRMAIIDDLVYRNGYLILRNYYQMTINRDLHVCALLVKLAFFSRMLLKKINEELKKIEENKSFWQEGQSKMLLVDYLVHEYCFVQICKYM